MPGLLGKKIGMTSVFSAEGVSVLRTVVGIGPYVMTQVKTADRDGYKVIQLGFQDAKDKRTTRPLQGHFKVVRVTSRHHLAESMDSESDYKLGDRITVEFFNDTHYVNVHGTSRGKGFQGVVKHHGFGGVGQSTHGRDGRLRTPDVVGVCSCPAKVFKGTRIAGQMGSKRVTIQNLEVIEITPEHNILVLKSSVPGARSSVIAMEK